MSIPRPTRPDPGLPEKKGIEPPPWANSGPLIEMTTFVCPDCGAEDHHGCGRTRSLDRPPHERSVTEPSVWAEDPPARDDIEIDDFLYLGGQRYFVTGITFADGIATIHLNKRMGGR